MTPKDAKAAKQAFDKIVKIHGDVGALAKAIGRSAQAIYLWKGIIPESALTDVLRATRRRVERLQKQVTDLPTRRQMRPDLYPSVAGASSRGSATTPKGVTNGKEDEDSSTQEENESRTTGSARSVKAG